MRWARRYAIAPEALAERGVAALALTGRRGRSPGRGAGDLVRGRNLRCPGRRSRSSRWRGCVGTQLGATQEKVGDHGRGVRRSAAARVPRVRRRGPSPARGSAPNVRRSAAGSRLVVEAREALRVTRRRADRWSRGSRQLLRADPALSVIVLSLDPLPRPWRPASRLTADRRAMHHLPAWVGLDDIAAAMSGASAVIATTRQALT